MPWWDFYKIFTYSFEQDPLSKQIKQQHLTGAGIGQPDAVPDIRADGSQWGGGQGSLRLRDSNEFIDLSTVTNRQSRYKEYERLRNVAEIEMAMTVVADEACIAGHTKIATLFQGMRSIEWITKNYDGEPFLVYCWDFKKNDYTLGWAYDPRIVKEEKTIKVLLDDGSDFVTTPDHRILKHDGEWIHAGELQHGDELKPFYKTEANRTKNDLPKKLFPRIFTFKDGWKHEREFVDEWKTGKNTNGYKRIRKLMRMMAEGLSAREILDLTGHSWNTIKKWMNKEGFTTDEVKWLGKKRDRRRVVGVMDWYKMPVYDLSVKDHENFCTDSVVMHNCQRGDDGHIFHIEVDDGEVKKELEYLLFHRKMLNMDRRVWNLCKKLCIFGDFFTELVMNIDDPKQGVLKIQELPPDSMYRLETTRGRLVEFQQSKEGPDVESLTRSEVTQATEADLMQSTAIRFSPYQIAHFRLGDDRKTFFPYGQSLIEPARGPAHQLRLMEDAMLVYRLTRAPERRVFYIDVGQMPPFKAEAFIERIKDQFRKKKVATSKSGQGGAGQVEERWHAPAADEDFWLPIRANANTRIETLPGAQNLGEIDDALYFRNKLYTALNFPKNYFNNEDPQTTRITLSAQDVKFARMIERIQSHIVDGIVEICERHLELRGFPESSYESLIVTMTPPSDWRELSRAEVQQSRLAVVTSLKTGLLMSDWDLMTKYMQFSEDETEGILSRNKIQKLEDAKLQIIMQNPSIVGIGTPGEGETELGSETGGPNPMIGPDGAPPEGAPPGPEQEAGGPQQGLLPGGPEAPGGPPQGQLGGGGEVALSSPDDEDIKKYNLQMQSYSRDQDMEDVDYSEI
ncbi:MAG: portal protein [Candidatus Thorarchaeota archaeon]|jgi:hypothetical protein